MKSTKHGILLWLPCTHPLAVALCCVMAIGPQWDILKSSDQPQQLLLSAMHCLYGRSGLSGVRLPRTAMSWRSPLLHHPWYRALSERMDKPILPPSLAKCRSGVLRFLHHMVPHRIILRPSYVASHPAAKTHVAVDRKVLSSAILVIVQGPRLRYLRLSRAGKRARLQRLGPSSTINVGLVI